MYMYLYVYEEEGGGRRKEWRESGRRCWRARTRSAAASWSPLLSRKMHLGSCLSIFLSFIYLSIYLLSIFLSIYLSLSLFIYIYT